MQDSSPFLFINNAFYGVPGLPTCPCTPSLEHMNISAPFLASVAGVQYNYGNSYGTGSCLPHDEDKQPSCHVPFAPDWCTQLWCYVDASNCTGVTLAESKYYPLSQNTIAASSLRYSYETCGASGVLRTYHDADEQVDASDELLYAFRMLRLFKLARLARAMEHMKRWETRIAMSKQTKIIIKCLLLLFFSCHWVACVMTAQTTFVNSHDMLGTWLGKAGYCAEDPDYEGQITCKGNVQIYFAAICWSTLIITATGGSDTSPNADSMIETSLVTVLVIVGALIWTYVIAMFCDLLANTDPVID
mmetsp:Transcript_67493/g.179503  ORF Transcript_67493/g.179503 Transcript_67493/m.179503 type:complete len:303 (+) Transcript_67493:98-1006(+)|eukprot:2343743-Prymnesium_polylepis.1